MFLVVEMQQEVFRRYIYTLNWKKNPAEIRCLEANKQQTR